MAFEEVVAAVVDLADLVEVDLAEVDLAAVEAAGEDAAALVVEVAEEEEALEEVDVDGVALEVQKFFYFFKLISPWIMSHVI